MIAFSGLGRMGGAIARRMHQAGHEMRVYDVVPGVRDEFRKAGFQVSESLAEAASGADSAWLCLPDANAVRSAVFGSGGLLEAEPLPSLCVDLTSSVPSLTREVGAALAARGVAMLDAPVSGGVSGAQEGQLTAMVGGDPDLVEEMADLMRSFASNVVWAGGLGAGHAVKAINNTLSAVSLAVTAEMLVTARASGIEADVAVRAFNAGTARSQNSEVKYPQHILTGTYKSGFTAGLMHKDIGVACKIAEDLGVALPLTAVVSEVWAALVARHGFAADFTRIYQLSEEWAAARDSGPPGARSKEDKEETDAEQR